MATAIVVKNRLLLMAILLDALHNPVFSILLFVNMVDIDAEISTQVTIRKVDDELENVDSREPNRC